MNPALTAAASTRPVRVVHCRMGKLISGKWSTEWYASDEEGHFVRDDAKFLGHVTADGSSGFQAEPGRYHLYVSLACPWAHRTLLARRLKRLEEVITISVVHPHLGDQGWEFRDAAGTIPDSVNQARYLHQVYTRCKPDYTGRVTVPVLWDRRTSTIVCNDSRPILRMLTTEFAEFADTSFDLCPNHLTRRIEGEIDALYRPINNGVYRAGFATGQSAYEEAVNELFVALDRLEERLSQQRYLVGSELTEADLCLFTTLIRFDAVYHYHFKCNRRRLVDYGNLSNYVRELYQLEGVAELCNFDHIKTHYYTSHPLINPNGLIPIGPCLDFASPHDRARFS